MIDLLLIGALACWVMVVAGIIARYLPDGDDDWRPGDRPRWRW